MRDDLHPFRHVSFQITVHGERLCDRKSDVNIHRKKAAVKSASDQRKRSTKWLIREDERFPLELSDYNFSSLCQLSDGDALYCRCDFEMVMTLLCERDSFADSDSSDEDDLEALMLALTEKPMRISRPRLNLDDLTTLECEQLFR